MNQISNPAILTVSFGTSHNTTREATIDAIERDIHAAFPAYPLYRAWTSKVIIAKLKQRDQVHIDTVEEALERMHSDGITDLIVQPTHIINGFENDAMKQAILSRSESFRSISFGAPLLSCEEDNRRIVELLSREFDVSDDATALVLMGHGTRHYANAVYAALDYRFKDMGHPNIFVGTVESYPSLDTVIRALSSLKPKKLLLAPLMIVAGDHALNDMAGEEEASWKSRLEAEGYPVLPILKGLGEYPEIRRLFIRHIQEACR